jgi:hypothetical protein
MNIFILTFAIMFLAACEVTSPAGETGEPGPRGPQGDTGVVGPQGLQGPQGVQGPQGFQGDAGATGAVGANGATGPQGPKGDAGAQGLQGLQGFTGATGAQGATGPQGLKGNTGAVGPAGPHVVAYGKDGKRLGIFVGSVSYPTNNVGMAGAFITFGTDAFPAPDGIFMSMAPTPVYFTNGSCTGAAHVATGDADGSIANQYWWTNVQIYQRGATAPSSIQAQSKMVGGTCAAMGLTTMSAYPVTSIGASYNLLTSLPWTVAVE